MEKKIKERNRAAQRVAREITATCFHEIFSISGGVLRDLVRDYIEDWSSADRERFIDDIIEEIYIIFQEQGTGI